MKIYADTSFLVSLYSPDADSAAAARTMQASSGDRFVSVFGELEVVNAMGLRVFRKEVSATQARLSLHDFEQDLRAEVLQLRPLTEQVFERARQLSRQTTPKLGVRTADSCMSRARSNCPQITSTRSTSSSESSPGRSVSS